MTEEKRIIEGVMDFGDVRDSLMIFGSRNSVILLKLSGLLLLIWMQVTSLGCGVQQQGPPFPPPPPPHVREHHLVTSVVLIVSKVYFVDARSDLEKKEKIRLSVQGEG